MAISSDRVQNRMLSGTELAEIIQKHVARVLGSDGMLTGRIAYGRVAYEVRVTLHLDNPCYPEHVSVTTSTPMSIQQIEGNPTLAAILTAPLQDLTPDADLVAIEVQVQVQSPNVERIVNGMPLTQTVRVDGIPIDKEVRYTGDIPDPATVGNTVAHVDKTEEQKTKWKHNEGKKK